MAVCRGVAPRDGRETRLVGAEGSADAVDGTVADAGIGCLGSSNSGVAAVCRLFAASDGRPHPEACCSIQTRPHSPVGFSHQLRSESCGCGA